MKSYEDIAKSVLKKSEERMAEKKRGGIIFGKKAAIASGLCAACLCGIGFWKLDSIRNSMDKQKIPQIVEMQPTTTPPTTTAAVTSAAPSTTAVTAVITDGSQTTQITVTTASSQTEITSTASVQTANTSASTTTASVQTQATQQTHVSQTTTAKSTTTKTHTTEKTTSTRAHTTTRKQTTTAKTTTTQRYTVTTANQTTIITPVPFTTSPPVYTTVTAVYTTIYYTHTLTSAETPAASETVPSNYIGNVTKTTVNQNFKRIYVSGISDSVYSLTSESFDITDEFYRDIYIQSADSFNSYGNYFTYASIKGYYYNSEYIALLYDGCNELFYYKRED